MFKTSINVLNKNIDLYPHLSSESTHVYSSHVALPLPLLFTLFTYHLNKPHLSESNQLHYSSHVAFPRLFTFYISSEEKICVPRWFSTR